MTRHCAESQADPDRMGTKADRDRARIAELRRLARLAQGREPDAEALQDRPGRHWEPETEFPRFVSVGAGVAGLLPEEVARRLKWSTRDVEAKVASGELESVSVGWMRMIPLTEVERIENLASR
jgi:hypothetical protein